MAKFDPAQYDCTPDANRARMDEIGTLITEATAELVTNCAGNNGAGGRARKKLRAAKGLIGVLIRTTQVMNSKRTFERKQARLAKKADVVVQTTNE